MPTGTFIGRSRTRRLLQIWLIAAALTAAIACSSSDADPTADSAVAGGGSDEPVINSNGPDLMGNQDWFNSDPVTIGGLALSGNVVLVDFWTYTCINCIRTLPFIVEWDRKYGDAGLTIIGVHSPEFEFEKVSANVASAIERYGIQYPVVQDNDMATWNNFGNRFWPAKYLFDETGEIIYTHFGEGEYLETELLIREALESAGHDISSIPAGDSDGPSRDPNATTQTRELYGGYGRNYTNSGVYAGQPEYYDDSDQVVLYTDNLPHLDNQWYLQGAWRNELEAIVHARETTDLEDYVVFKYDARSVNVVIASVAPEGETAASGDEFIVYVEVDGQPIAADSAGDDITFDDEGRSLIRVDSAREYRVVEAPSFGQHEILLRSNSDRFGMFAVTFGNNLEGA
jgi:thiol-disulfide isomerase/thioredoxin